MWSLQKPSPDTIRAFLASQRQCEYSYTEVGQSRDGAPPGFKLDHNRVQLGSGKFVGMTAMAALRQWRMFPKPWTEIHPVDTPLEVGNVVAILAHAYGLWWLNACRIVYVIKEQSPIWRYGFAYGTLPEHVECGEERFLIEWDEQDRVWYDLRAFSRPRHWLVGLAYPLARRMQRQFIKQSQAAMLQAVSPLTASDS